MRDLVVKATLGLLIVGNLIVLGGVLAHSSTVLGFGLGVSGAAAAFIWTALLWDILHDPQEVSDA